MALKSIGILVALCATLTIAFGQKAKYNPENEYYYEDNNDYYDASLKPVSEKETPFIGHNGLNKPHFPHRSEESGVWANHDFPKPHFPYDSQDSGEWQHHGFAKPHFTQNSESGESVHHSRPKPHFSHISEALNEPHRLPSLHFPRDPNEMGGLNLQGGQKPHITKESREWGYSEYPKPNFPHHSEQLGNSDYHSFSKPNFPQNSQSENLGHISFSKPHSPYNSKKLGYHHALFNTHLPNSPHESNFQGLHKPLFPHGSEELGEHQGIQKPHLSHSSQESSEHHSLPHSQFLHSSQELKSGYETYRPDWYNPNFLQNPDGQQINFEEMKRRRPLFYPIFPYHPFYPHAHSTSNDEQFETIEARKYKNNAGSQSHRNFFLEDDSQESHEQKGYEPHFPMNSNHTGENSMELPSRPFHHGFHRLFRPNFKLFHKDPAFSEGNIEIGPNMQEYPNINSDDLHGSQETQHYGPPSPPKNQGFQGPFIIVAIEEVKLQSIINDILYNFHNGHKKPHHHGHHKPNENEDESDEEGSGEKEISYISIDTNTPLIQDDDAIEIEN